MECVGISYGPFFSLTDELLPPSRLWQKRNPFSLCLPPPQNLRPRPLCPGSLVANTFFGTRPTSHLLFCEVRLSIQSLPVSGPCSLFERERTLKPPPPPLYNFFLRIPEDPPWLSLLLARQPTWPQFFLCSLFSPFVSECAGFPFAVMTTIATPGGSSFFFKRTMEDCSGHPIPARFAHPRAPPSPLSRQSRCACPFLGSSEELQPCSVLPL